ncbi:tetratricopeptide repeat protein [Chryseobacterium viscerum]|uniref:tetratricopeptide repeat protein n=1 Tax=Chryseobacterium viscerum TaxID=1037377 RepID=UPI0022229B65|nr:tetratricopeptide repeat protein [Chryseobacterium viscerum]MCW1960745.1 tetratricopeptide repeat protein [Chryseobacterium viscerum]
MIKFLLFLLLFSFMIIDAQQKMTVQKIDNWLKKADMLHVEGKVNEYIEQHRAIIEASEKINYSKGIATGNIRLAAAYSFEREFKKSIQYLEIAEKEEYTKTDYELQSNILRQLGMCYNEIGLSKKAIYQFKKMKSVASQIKEKENRDFLVNFSQNNIGVVYSDSGQVDSAYAYYKTVYKNLNSLENKNQRLNTLLSIVTVNMAKTKFSQNQLDSAMYYLQRYNAYPANGKNNYNKYMAAELMGKIYFTKKQYPLSLEYYNIALQLTEKGRYKTELKDLYYLLYEVYSKQGDQTSAIEYLKKYTVLNDSLKNIEISNIDAPINRLIKENEEPLKSKSKYLLYWATAGVLILISILIILRYKHKDEKRKIVDHLTIKNQETKELKQQLNVAFDEIVELAKNNDPVFLTRFEEVYPHVIKKLLQINPELQSSELKFCALLFLSFSTKDIARYTFVQPQSIQTRKNRLRKKLNIGTGADIYIWMKNINNLRS